jgi:hypothetical protein
VEQPGLVDAAGAQLGLHAHVGIEGFRQEVQVAIEGAGFLNALAVLFDPAAFVLAVRHHQQRAAELLVEAGTAGDVAQHVVAQACRSSMRPSIISSGMSSSRISTAMVPSL